MQNPKYKTILKMVLTSGLILLMTGCDASIISRDCGDCRHFLNPGIHTRHYVHFYSDPSIQIGHFNHHRVRHYSDPSIQVNHTHHIHAQI